MIHYLVTRPHAYTMASFLGSWGRDLAARVRVVPYDEALGGAVLPTGRHVYVFSDLDRLSARATPAESKLLAEFHLRLVAACGGQRVLNDPARSLLRYDLLRRLHADGLNRFGVWRAGEMPQRWPVFLRREEGFERHAPALLRDANEYTAALQAAGRALGGLLAVEFCDTARDGVYRKYGAFVVGERIVPRHVFFSRNWLVKESDRCGADELREELAYLEANPHARELAAIAAAARIAYGRIDYSLLDGRIQTWEINTNPLVANRGSTMGPAERDAVHARFTADFCAALERLED